MKHAADSSKYRWVNRSDIIFPSDQYKTYRLIMQSYWIVNDMGDPLFWDKSPQCNSSEELAKALLRGTQKHVGTHAFVTYIERAWVPVDPRDWS